MTSFVQPPVKVRGRSAAVSTERVSGYTIVDAGRVVAKRLRVSVYDGSTGEIAVIAMSPQRGLSRQDAEHTAELLNRRAVGQGERLASQ